MTDTERQDLIELVNNLYHAFTGDAVAVLCDPLRAALPCRLLAAAGDVLAQTYSSAALARLDEDALEGIVLSLRQAFHALELSLQQVTSALPAATPEALRDKAREAGARLAAIEQERAELFTAAQDLLAAEDELLMRQRELDELTQRRDKLLAAQRALQQTNLADLRAEINEKTQEGAQLKQELSDKISSVDQAYAAIGQLQATLKLYAEANVNVARNIPNLMDGVRENLESIKQQLAKADSDLKHALKLHQEAHGVWEKIPF